MKKILVVGFALLVSALNAAWKYDPDAKTLTDGVLIFNAILANDNELSVDATDGHFAGDSVPETFSIDFTTISDTDDKQYVVVKFGDFSYVNGNYFKAYADRLTEFIAPDCKNIFGNGCFGACNQLTKVELNEEVTFSSDRPFVDCSSLSDFSPRTLLITAFKTQFFSGCRSLAGEIKLPNCTSIAAKAFSGCSKLEKVSMPKVTAIEGQAFYLCSSLREVETSGSLTKIKSTAFSGCTSLRGDCIRELLHQGITMLGSSNEDIKTIFEGCSSFDGVLEWDFPNITTYKYQGVSYPINLVGQGFFSGCSKLEKVVFKTPVLEIRNSAFKEIAPGAEFYAPDTVPESLGASFVGNLTGPFPKFICSEETLEEYLEKIGVNHHVILKSQFNTDLGQEFEYTTGKYRKWKDIAAKMATDTQMCELTGDEITLKRKGVVAFVLQKSTNQQLTSLVGFWVMKAAKKGFSIKVR